jgi:hypothetical protein
MADTDGHPGIVRRGETIGIGNEFTGVNVRKVWTRQGERLELELPRTEQSILLDAMQLEILVLQRPERFTELFERELGSESGERRRP